MAAASTFALGLLSPAWADCLRVVVHDPAGLPIHNARVSVDEEETLTDERGSFEICSFGSGSRRVVVKAKNFRKSTFHINETDKKVVFQLELEPQIETPIVVTGTPKAQELAEVNRSIAVIPVEDSGVPAWALSDILKQDSSIDLRERGPDGTQADLSIRGSSFEQVLVLVNGIRVNDVQTGHHNMDVPLPLESVHQVEVLHGSGSTLYGSDAIGGTVNFVTRKPSGKELKLMAGVGDFGWNRESVNTGFVKGFWSQQISLSRDFSSGFREGRDYRNVAFSSESFFDTSFGSTSLMFSSNDRPFGANGFYCPCNSWEKTGTQFLALNQTLGKSPDRLQHRFNFAYRRHTDHFVLYRYQPEIYQNFHTTNIYQGNYVVNGRLNDLVNWSGGASYLSEGITSSKLGLHSRDRVAAFFMLNLRPTDRLNLVLGLREEVWRKWQGETSPTLSIGYWLTRKFKLRGQLGHAYRVPSYTDLFYEDPFNQGNENLLPESAWNYEAGLDWYLGQETTVSATWFQRRENETIDWIQTPGLAKFQATNFQDLTFTGIETQFRQQLNRSSEIVVNYTAMRASKLLHPGVTSRYVFNFPLNSLSVSYGGSLTKNCTIKTRFGAFNRTWQGTKALWDASIFYAAGPVKPFFHISNLLDVYHAAFQGVPQPGRWIRGGIIIEIF